MSLATCPGLRPPSSQSAGACVDCQAFPSRTCWRKCTSLRRTTMTVTQRSDLTFKHNARLGRHGWLRLTPAYSVRLVEDVLSCARGQIRVLDPFSGTGTTGLACAERGFTCDLLEINPFLVWFTEAKVREYSDASLQRARKLVDVVVRTPAAGEVEECWTPPIRNVERWWSPVALDALRLLWARLASTGDGCEQVIDLIKIAFCRQVIAWSNASFGHQSMSFKRSQVTLLDALDGEDLLHSRVQEFGVGGDRLRAWRLRWVCNGPPGRFADRALFRPSA